MPKATNEKKGVEGGQPDSLGERFLSSIGAAGPLQVGRPLLAAADLC